MDVELSRRALLAAGAGTVLALADPHRADASTSIDKTARPFGPLALVGDSLSAHRRDLLRRDLADVGIGPITIDVRGGRAINRRAAKRFDTGAERVDAIRRRNADPGRWIIALAGNDFDRYRRGKTTPYAEISRLLDQLGPDARVAWPTVWRKAPHWWPICDQFNTDLHRVAAERPNLTVAEWADWIRPHPEWFSDGVHLRGDGITERRMLMVSCGILLTLGDYAAS